VTFNFDFGAAGVVPPPPYLGISFYSGVDTTAALQPGNFGLWTGFSELDGGGTQIYGPFNAILISTVLQDAGAVDGVFSMVLSVINGSITVDPYAHTWLNNSVQGAGPVFPTQAAVPEPSTLTLFGVGLAVSAWHRRQRTA
jgi:hypothetical protein